MLGDDGFERGPLTLVSGKFGAHLVEMALAFGLRKALSVNALAGFGELLR